MYNIAVVKEMPKCGFGFVTWCLFGCGCPLRDPLRPGIRDVGSASLGGGVAFCKLQILGNISRTFFRLPSKTRGAANIHAVCETFQIISIFPLHCSPSCHPLIFSQRLCNLWKGGQLKARQGAGEWVMRGRLASGSWTIPPNWKAIGGTLLANYIADKTWHLSETTLLWKFTARPFAWQPIVKESRGNRSDSTRFSKTS